MYIDVDVGKTTYIFCSMCDGVAGQYQFYYLDTRNLTIFILCELFFSSHQCIIILRHFCGTQSTGVGVKFKTDQEQEASRHVYLKPGN